MTFNYFAAYFLIIFIATITPGPNMLLALNHGVNHGIVRTIFSGLGNLTGNLLLALISIIGLGAVLVASGLIFNILKWLGIIYLLYVGLSMAFEPVGMEIPDKYDNKPARNKNKQRLFLDGFLIAIGNPKGILFFTALFPQFINVNDTSISEFLIIFLTLAGVAFGCYMLYAVFGAKLTRLIRLQSFRKNFNRVSGSLLILAGLAIAISKI